MGRSSTPTGLSKVDNNIKKYGLKVWQQPSRARLCSFKEENDTMDRRPVDPPPVVEMQSFNTDLTEMLEETSFFIRATIVHVDASSWSPEPEYEPVKTPTGADATAGETIQTPEKLKGLDGRPGAVVVFAKLSVRIPGVFRLKFTLYETSDEGITEVTHTVSEPFEVFSPKLFRGMRESTALTRHLAGQGLKVKLRTDTTVGRQGESRRRGSTTYRATPPESPLPSPITKRPPRSLVWQQSSKVSLPPLSAYQGRDDGSIHPLRVLSSRFDYTPSPPSADLSAFSLDATASGSTSRTTSRTLSSSLSKQPSLSSLSTTMSSARSESPALPPLTTRLGYGDDGTPNIPIRLRSLLATEPPIPPIPLPRDTTLHRS